MEKNNILRVKWRSKFCIKVLESREGRRRIKHNLRRKQGEIDFPEDLNYICCLSSDYLFVLLIKTKKDKDTRRFFARVWIGNRARKNTSGHVLVARSTRREIARKRRIRKPRNIPRKLVAVAAVTVIAVLVDPVVILPRNKMLQLSRKSKSYHL